MTPFPTHEDFLTKLPRVYVDSISLFYGYEIVEVYLREDDRTFWQVTYFQSEHTNNLKQGIYEVIEVEPFTVTETRYKVKHVHQ